MRSKAAALLITGSLVLAGCASDGDEDAAPPADGQGTAVSVVDFAFEPEEISVSPGTTVEWSYTEGSSRHTVTFDDGEESDELEPGDTYARTFDEPGAYPYVCFFHPRMTGTVTVAE